MSATALSLMSYPDFVAAIGQENTPPGGARTVHTWSSWVPSPDKGHIVLDLACSTGFSGRAWAAERSDVGRVEGIDIASSAVAKATELANQSDLTSFNYQVADACKLPFHDETFDVVLGGCNFAFIENREEALREVRRVLKSGGVLLTADFFYRYQPDPSVLDEVEKAVGFRPGGNWSEEFWDAFYSNELQRRQGERTDLSEVPQYYLVRACFDAMMGKEEFGIAERTVALRRLIHVRSVLNRQRALQGMALGCWAKA